MHHSSEETVSLAKYFYALKWLYLTSIALPKISILCLYLRIFTSRAARYSCYLLIGIIAANWAAFIVLASTFECSSLAYHWNPTPAEGRCLNESTLAKATSAPNVATDVVMLVLPVFTVRRLNASYIRKLGLTIVFLTGSVLVTLSPDKTIYDWS